jgi:hypothetical protein
MSWRPIPICRSCGQSVGEAHWQLFQHITCQPPGEEDAATIAHRAQETLTKVQEFLRGVLP